MRSLNKLVIMVLWTIYWLLYAVTIAAWGGGTVAAAATMALGAKTPSSVPPVVDAVDAVDATTAVSGRRCVHRGPSRTKDDPSSAAANPVPASQDRRSCGPSCCA